MAPTHKLSELQAFKILGLNNKSTVEDLKTSYRQLAKKYHPDANSGDRTKAEQFALVQEAYEILRDITLSIESDKVITIFEFKEAKFKLEKLQKLQKLIDEEKYLEAVVLADALSSRFSTDSEVSYWHANTYFCCGNSYLKSTALPVAKAYLDRALELSISHKQLYAEIVKALQICNEQWEQE